MASAIYRLFTRASTLRKKNLKSIPALESEIKCLQDEIEALTNENKENRLAKEELAASEKKYRTIFENTGTATILINNDKTISMINSEFERLSGYSRKDIEGKRLWTDFIYTEDLDKMEKFHSRRRKSPEMTPRNYKCRVLKNTGEVKTAVMTVDLIRGTKQSVASVRDISEQVRLQNKILEISERERRQIGHNLHDDLGQHLIGIEALSALLIQRLKQKSSEEYSLAKDISGLIGDAIQKTRVLVKGLCPVDMDSRGLETALHELGKYIEKIFSIICTIEYDTAIRIINNTIATNLYHIIQEAANNAQRHGKATKILISLEIINKYVIVSVKDNGTGFSGKRSDDGLGLMIMSFRASSIGALFNINTSPDNGTEITCTIKQEYL